MPISVTIPTLGRPANVKDAVVSILSREWPLSLKKLYNSIRGLGLDVSYQAVHKAAQELMDQEIVMKEGGGYKLNPVWLNGIEEFGSKVGTSYKAGLKHPMETLKENGIVNLNFKTLKEFSEFCIPVFFVQCPNPENKIGICRLYHIYPMLGYSENFYRGMRDFFTKNKFYSLCKSDTSLDRWFADFFIKTGKKVRLGAGMDCEHDVIIVGDCIMQVFFPPEFKKKMNSLYETVKDVGEVGIDRLIFHALEEQTEINVVIFRNPGLAEQMRREALEYFKKDGDE